MFNKKLLYILSFTWGLPMTVIGLIVGAILYLKGIKPKKHGICWHFEVGERWGGLNLGLVFLTEVNPSGYTENHELGHAIQNCYLGFLMPFVVCIPSAIRYWYREYRSRIGKPCTTPYYSIWFERYASLLGMTYIEKWGE